VRINSPIINVHKKDNLKSEVVTQLLYGDTFSKIKKINSWIKIKNRRDKYKGYIKNNNFLNKISNSHKVSNLYANLYSKPKNKYKIKKKLSFGSRIKIIESEKSFCKFDNLWIKKKDIDDVNNRTKDLFKNIEKFINVKYKWGGKSFSGIDCSALVQLMLNYNNKFCPRDTKDQIKYFKKKVILKNIKKNNLIFWRGHVAIALSNKKLIHAYGPLKKVVVGSIKKTVDKIYQTANLKIIAIRKIS
jgi:cell wall-associated NlpC family hydrolase